MDDRRLQEIGKADDEVVRAGAPRTAQHRDAARPIQQLGQGTEILTIRLDLRPARGDPLAGLGVRGQ
jgi:hypothetical protein